MIAHAREMRVLSFVSVRGTDSPSSSGCFLSLALLRVVLQFEKLNTENTSKHSELASVTIVAIPFRFCFICTKRHRYRSKKKTFRQQHEPGEQSVETDRCGVPFPLMHLYPLFCFSIFPVRFLGARDRADSAGSSLIFKLQLSVFVPSTEKSR